MPVLDLLAAKDYLKIEGHEYDDLLTDVIAAAQTAIEHRVGPLEPATAPTAVRVRGVSNYLVLPTGVVAQLVSVTPLDGPPLNLSDLSVDYGVISSKSAWFGYSWYDVVYSAGRATCPPDLLMAVRELVRHLWRPQRGGAQRPGGQPSEAASNTLPGAAYLFPFRIEQLLEPYKLPGIA